MHPGMGSSAHLKCGALRSAPPNPTKSPPGSGDWCQEFAPSSVQCSACPVPVLLPCASGERFSGSPSPRPLTPQILERTLEPDSSDEEPPPVYSPPAYESQEFGSRYPCAPPTPPPR